MNSISISREYIKNENFDCIKNNEFELEKKELLPFLYRVYKKSY